MVLLLRWSHNWGGPITEVVLSLRWSYHWGAPITCGPSAEGVLWVLLHNSVSNLVPVPQFKPHSCTGLKVEVWIDLWVILIFIPDNKGMPQTSLSWGGNLVTVSTSKPWIADIVSSLSQAHKTLDELEELADRPEDKKVLSVIRTLGWFILLLVSCYSDYAPDTGRGEVHGAPWERCLHRSFVVSSKGTCSLLWPGKWG